MTIYYRLELKYYGILCITFQLLYDLLIFLGFPQPEYRWMKDGVFLSEFSSEPFYKIRSVTKADAGSYQCYAKNSVGTIVSEKIPLVVACKYKINSSLLFDDFLYYIYS